MILHARFWEIRDLESRTQGTTDTGESNVMNQVSPAAASAFESRYPEAKFGDHLEAVRDQVAVTLPGPGERFRVAFVGQSTYFEVCSQEAPSDVIEPKFIETRSGADSYGWIRALREFAPHVIFVFRPEVVPHGLLKEFDALVVGMLTEPLPRAGGKKNKDLERRLSDLKLADASQFDRIIAFDPNIIPAASTHFDVWRSMPLPVADSMFCDSLPLPSAPVRALFVGRSTPHRSNFLASSKHTLDLHHVEHGLFGDQLKELSKQYFVAINLHNTPYPNFENRVPLHLAMGNLVASEPLSPRNGLDPDLDFIEVHNSDDLWHLLHRVADDPQRYDLVRARGRQKAENFRASVVYRRLLLDLLLDVAQFGDRSEKAAISTA